MQATTEETIVLQKTRDLCQSIVDQPEFQLIIQHMEAFRADEAAQGQFQVVVAKNDELQQKQSAGVPIGDQEIADFEQQREALMNNPVARNFLDAQQQMHKTQESVMQFVSKTYELGRVPTMEDFSSGSCGSGCGCH
jgi:cell fate (sporulation/competence/biofilm development) regulator YlbF (YheA/YmcA/DUF963 family)